MNLELAAVAEKLALEFAELPVMVVIGALCACADRCDTAGPFFIEQATRAHLLALRVADPEPPSPVIPEQARDEQPRSRTRRWPEPAADPLGLPVVGRPGRFSDVAPGLDHAEP